ncbi:hypothetical protein EGT74_24965 [Chitinophaga lutea]|uniref:Tetratricopeptide repeat protein n=1 Tax=Chitinophaga lutea TaxID=2488634 RepID=A0A3N4PPD7_9BACT|nr:hypothetical protein [Chitinophaga lutea]RPE05630.1 hypothetical protein EGT74_24965 [Chitinophaga lutea]
MTANRIIHHIFNQPDLRQVDQASLEQLVEKYPYFAAARMFLARKEFTDKQDLTAPALKKAQLYSGTPHQVHQFVTASLLSGSLENNVVAIPVETPVEPAEQTQTPVEAAVPEAVNGIEAVIPPIETAPEPAAEAPSAAVHADITADEPVLSAEDAAILEELAAEDARNAAVAAKVEAVAPAAPTLDEEDIAIAAKYDEFLYEEKPAAKEPEPAIAAKPEAPAAEAPDEIVAIDYEAEKAAAEFEAARTLSEPDEIVAIDYEAEKAAAEFEAARTLSEPDEIVAIDYEAEKAAAEFEAARTLSEPDEIVAIDYEAEKAAAEFEAARTLSEPDEIVAIDYEAEKELVEFEAARTQSAPDDIIAVDYSEIREAEQAAQYEAEPEDEDIVVEAAAQEGPGITLPAAVNGTAHETAAPEEGPIKIHPMDTPEEETTLTFQPLYTEDYFAYKKLKDPNSAEMMNDKAAAEMRSFTDWLRELKDSFAGKATKDWYHQQLNKLYEDDEPEVSERVEKMAIESITLNDDIVSETLAEIWVRQHQHGKAIAVYQKLSLLNPDKNAYFAQKIKDLQLLTDNNK